MIKLRRIKLVGLVAYKEKIRNTHKMNENTEGNRPLGRLDRRWLNNIIRPDCISSGRGPVVSYFKNLRVLNRQKISPPAQTHEFLNEERAT